MNVTQVIAGAVGPSAPIAIAGQSLAGSTSEAPVAARYQMQPVISAFVSPGANLNYLIEATTDQVPSPSGNWLPINSVLAGGAVQSNVPLFASCWLALSAMFTGVRVNLTSCASGTVTLQVAQ